MTLGVCRRCGGTTFPDDDGDMACLQCGGLVYRRPPIDLTAEEELRRLRPAKADTRRKLARVGEEQMRLVEA